MRSKIKAQLLALHAWLKPRAVPWIGQENWRTVGKTVRTTLNYAHYLTSKAALYTLAKLIYGGLERAAYSFFWMKGKLTPARGIKKVLHVSILSHKPFMISREMRKQGVHADFLALNVDIGRLNEGYDYGVSYGGPGWKRWIEKAYYSLWVMPQYDVIHSHFNSFLSEDAREFRFMKRLGRVIVFHYRGCDLRHRSANLRINPGLNCCQECDYPIGSCDTPYQMERIRLTRELGDAFFTTTPDLQDFAPYAEHLPFIPPSGVDFDAIVPTERSPGIFRVVTSSNHHGVDGTEYIRRAVAVLKSEGRAIELVEVNKMPYREALRVYKSADVFVGKLRMGYYNNANIETLMLGVPNMSYIRPEYWSKTPDCPIIQTRPEDVYANLKDWMDRPEDLKALGRRGPDFIRKYHDTGTLIRRMFEVYREAAAVHALKAAAGRRPVYE